MLRGEGVSGAAGARLAGSCGLAHKPLAAPAAPLQTSEPCLAVFAPLQVDVTTLYFPKSLQASRSLHAGCHYTRSTLPFLSRRSG